LKTEFLKYWEKRREIIASRKNRDINKWPCECACECMCVCKITILYNLILLMVKLGVGNDRNC
jgi:hypothetical protein